MSWVFFLSVLAQSLFLLHLVFSLFLFFDTHLILILSQLLLTWHMVLLHRTHWLDWNSLEDQRNWEQRYIQCHSNCIGYFTWFHSCDSRFNCQFQWNSTDTGSITYCRGAGITKSTHAYFRSHLPGESMFTLQSHLSPSSPCLRRVLFSLFFLFLLLLEQSILLCLFLPSFYLTFSYLCLIQVKSRFLPHRALWVFSSCFLLP